MKGKKVLALVMCAVMAAGITVPVMAEEKDDSGREVINFFRADDGHMDVMQNVIDAFEASQDKYAVNIVVAPNDSNQEKSQLTTSFSAGSSEYDVVSIDTAWAGDLAGAGYLEALDGYMKESGRKALLIQELIVRKHMHCLLIRIMVYYFSAKILFHRKMRTNW